MLEHNIGTLATASNSGIPHAATIYFVTEQDFLIYFITKKDTTKSRNLQENSNAALAVFDATSQTTVQAFGKAVEMLDPHLLQSVFEKVSAIAQNTSGGHQPPVTKLDAGDYVVYCLKPQTVRMAEFVKADYPPVDQLFDVVTPIN